MKVGKVIRDTQIKAIKTHLKDTTIGFGGFDVVVDMRYSEVYYYSNSYC